MIRHPARLVGLLMTALGSVGCSFQSSGTRKQDSVASAGYAGSLAGTGIRMGGATSTNSVGRVGAGGSGAAGGPGRGDSAPSTGGALATGGNPSTGWVLATGGNPSTGGALATAGVPSTGGALATAGVPSTADHHPTALPVARQSCPQLVNGMVDFLGKRVSLSVGPADQKGPMLFYWHGASAGYSEVESGFSDAIADVKADGGVVASFTDTIVTASSQATSTGSGIWYAEDIGVADEVLACAITQGLVDPRRVHVSGYSGGGLQCAAMSHLRSGYVASVLCMSGGFVPGMPDLPLQDPSHVPAAIVAHGASGLDTLILLDFAICSESYNASVASKGGLAINCNDGGDHFMSMSARAGTMGPVAWKFFAENPFGSNNHYPNGLPSYFPSQCAIVK